MTQLSAPDCGTEFLEEPRPICPAGWVQCSPGAPPGLSNLSLSAVFRKCYLPKAVGTAVSHHTVPPTCAGPDFHQLLGVHKGSLRAECQSGEENSQVKAHRQGRPHIQHCGACVYWAPSGGTEDQGLNRGGEGGKSWGCKGQKLSHPPWWLRSPSAQGPHKAHHSSIGQLCCLTLGTLALGSN